MTDGTYQLAFQFRQSRLWRKLQPDDIFAVRLSDEVIVPCHVEGRNGEDIALVINDARLDFVAKEELTSDELASIKRCARKYKIKLKDSDLYPQFISKTPDFWTDILEATLYLSSCLSKKNKTQVGFGSKDILPLLERECGTFSIGTISLADLDRSLVTQETAPNVTAPASSDNIPDFQEPEEVPNRVIQKLKKFRRKRVLQCDIIRLERTIEADDGALIHPALCFPVDKETQKCLSVWYFTEDPYDPAKMLKQLIDVLIQSNYYPKKIEIRTEEAEALLRSFCQKANIQLRRIKTLPELDMEFEKFRQEFEKKLEENASQM